MKHPLIFLSTFIILAANTEAAPRDTNVNVVNTPDVNVVTMPTVEAQQSGEWNVNINGVPGVTIENGLLDPVPVEITNQPTNGELVNIPLTGIFLIGDDSLSEYSEPNSPPAKYVVPSGKKLTIKHVACRALTTTSTDIKLWFDAGILSTDQNAYRENTGISGPMYPILLQKTYSQGTLEYYDANQSMLAVIGGATSGGYLILKGIRNETSNTNAATCVLTGELMDL